MAAPRSRPRRRSFELPAVLPPSQWPDWLLSFQGGYFPDDSEETARQRAAFREWRNRREEWFTSHGLTFDLAACTREAERRRG